MATAATVGVLAVFALFQRSAAISGQEQAEAALRESTRAARTMTLDLAGELLDAEVPRRLVRVILERSLGLQDSLAGNFPDDAALQELSVTSRLLVGKVFERQGDRDAALAAYTEALATAEAVVEQEDTPTKLWGNIPLLKLHIGSLYMNRGEAVEAEDALRSALAIYRDGFAPDDRFDPHTSGAIRRIRVAETLTYLATVLNNEGRADEADELITEAVDVYRVIEEEAGDDAVILLSEFPITLAIAADVKQALGDMAAAIVLYEEAVPLARAVLADDPGNLRRMSGLREAVYALGAIRLRQGDPERAEALMTEATDLSRAEIAVDNRDTAAISGHAQMLESLAIIAGDRGDIASAAASSQEALRWRLVLTELLPGDAFQLQQVAATSQTVGHYKFQLGDHAGAIADLEGGLAAVEQMTALGIEAHHDLTLGAQETLATVLRRSGRPQEALEMIERTRRGADELIARYPGDPVIPRYIAVAATTAGRIHADASDLDAALRDFEEGVGRFADLHAAQSNPFTYGRDYSIALELLAATLRDAGRPEEAFDPLDRARAVGELLIARDPGNPSLRYERIDGLLIRAATLEDLGRTEDELKEYFAAATLLEPLVIENPEREAWKESYLDVLDRSGMLLYRAAAYEGAIPVFEHVSALANEFLETSPTNTTFSFYARDSREYAARSLARRSDQLIGAGEFGGAVIAAERALDLLPDDLLTKSYLANAYLANGNSGRARSLYETHRGDVFEDGSTWDDVVRADLATMRETGIERPLIDEILAALEAEP